MQQRSGGVISKQIFVPEHSVGLVYFMKRSLINSVAIPTLFVRDTILETLLRCGEKFLISKRAHVMHLIN